MTREQFARAFGLAEAAAHLKGRGGKPPAVETIRRWVKHGYRPRGCAVPPVFLRAVMHGAAMVTVAEWCDEFEAARAAAGAVEPARVRRPAARKAAAMDRRAVAYLDRVGVA